MNVIILVNIYLGAIVSNKTKIVQRCITKSTPESIAYVCTRGKYTFCLDRCLRFPSCLLNMTRNGKYVPYCFEQALGQ